MRTHKRIVIAILLLGSACAAQTAAPEKLGEPDANTLMQRVAQSMKRYSRDISEIRIQVTATTQRFDQHGDLKNKHTSTHTMQFVKRFVKGDRVVRELTWKRSMFHWVSPEEANADSATSLFALLFDNGKLDDSHTYALVAHTKSNRLDVHIGHAKPCEPFDPMDVKQRLWCGEADIQLTLDTLTPLHGSFDEAGLPKTFSDTEYRSFHFDEDFQFAPVAGSREPLLLPSKVVCSWETPKGKTVVESHYAVAGK